MANTSTNTTKEKKEDTVVYLGAQVEINKQTVDLMPKTPINKVKEEGIEFELARSLQLGCLGDAIKDIAVNDLGMNEKDLVFTDTKSNPNPTQIAPLDNVIKATMNAELTIRALHYKKYPTKDEGKKYFEEHPKQIDKAGQVDYLFAASATCPKSEGEEGFFKFNGLFVVIAKGIEQKEVTEVLEDSIRQFEAPKSALPAASENETDTEEKQVKKQEKSTK